MTNNKEPSNLPAGEQITLLETDGHELLLSEEQQRGRFTGERVARNLERYKGIIRAIAEKQPIRTIAKAWSVSANTVYAIMEREGLAIDTEKKDITRKWTVAAHVLVERLIEEHDRIPLQQLGLNAAVAATKRSELLGDPNVVVEFRHAVDASADAFFKRLEAMKRAKVESIIELPQTGGETPPTKLKDV